MPPEPQRFRQEGSCWLDTPGGGRSWPKEKMQCVRAAEERVAEAETSDHAHLRKQETVSQWGSGGSVCREGCSSLSRLSQTAVEKRGCHRETVAPRRGQDSRPSLGFGERLSSEGTLDRVVCFMRSTITASCSPPPPPPRMSSSNSAAAAQPQRPPQLSKRRGTCSGILLFERLSVATSV